MCKIFNTKLYFHTTKLSVNFGAYPIHITDIYTNFTDPRSNGRPETENAGHNPGTIRTIRHPRPFNIYKETDKNTEKKLQRAIHQHLRSLV